MEIFAIAAPLAAVAACCAAPLAVAAFWLRRGTRRNRADTGPQRLPQYENSEERQGMASPTTGDPAREEA